MLSCDSFGVVVAERGKVITRGVVLKIKNGKALICIEQVFSLDILLSCGVL